MSTIFAPLAGIIIFGHVAFHLLLRIEARCCIRHYRVDELLNTPDRMNEVTEEKGVDEPSPDDRHGCGDDKHN